VLSDEAAVLRVYNERRPILLPPFTLVCRRWSHFKNASSASLPILVDVELEGIPAHAWELETVEHLLDEWCWASELHPNTANRRDYSSFRLRAWSVQPELVPTAMELAIVEPPVLAEEAFKSVLCYQVKVAVSPVIPVGAPLPPPPPNGDQKQQGPSRRRWRSSSLSESWTSSAGSTAPRRWPSCACACKAWTAGGRRPRGRPYRGA
jgi:hypothetical protein